MEQGRIWLGKKGSEQLLSNVKRRFREEPFEIVREERTASGRLVQDVIAEKTKFIITYSKVSGPILESLAAIYSLGGPLNLMIEQRDGSIKEYEVKFRPFGRSRFLMIGEWIWEGITIELEEY